jgi:mannose-6-phosphate isomerase-like protein (cupin superfamily)
LDVLQRSYGCWKTIHVYANHVKGWVESGQTLEFDEYTFVLNGMLHIKTEKESFDVKAGEAFVASRGEWVRYSTPHSGGAVYVAVCVPAFIPALVYGDEI